MSDRREIDDRREPNGDKFKAGWDVLKWLLGVSLAAFLAYNATVNDVNARIAGLEAEQRGTDRRLNEINGRLESLNLKMDQILLRSREEAR